MSNAGVSLIILDNLKDVDFYNVRTRNYEMTDFEEENNCYLESMENRVSKIDECLSNFSLEIEKRIIELENRMKDFEHNYISLILKITKEHLYEHDERICGLENIETEKRLINLELSLVSHNCILQKRIDSLTDMYKEISLKHVKLIDVELNRKPYICPVCDGKTYCTKPNFQDGGDITFECKSCEGTGIVWG